MKIKLIRQIIIPLTLLILMLSPVIGMGLGISPARLDFKNVLKGGYAQGKIYVSTESPDNITMTIERLDSVAQWLIFDDNVSTFNINNANPHTLKVMVYPPTDIISTNYTAQIRIVSSGQTTSSGGMSTAVLPAFLINIHIEIVGEQLLTCSAGGLIVSDSEENYPISIRGIILNNGNVRISPDITFEIWDIYMEKLLRTTQFNLDETLPTEQTEFSKEALNDLLEGQYYAKINIPLCNIVQTSMFSIVQKGGVIDKGELLSVESINWAKANEILPVTAYFRNDGVRIVSAKFKGEITDTEGNIVKIIDTDAIDIAPGKVGELKSFFKPLKEGQYLVNGHVIYNKKLSYEKGYVINVNGIAPPTVNNNTWILIIIFTIIILVMLILIKHKKTKMKKHR